MRIAPAVISRSTLGIGKSTHGPQILVAFIGVGTGWVVPVRMFMLL
jgi:hypothetical protein